MASFKVTSEIYEEHGSDANLEEDCTYKLT